MIYIDSVISVSKSKGETHGPRVLDLGAIAFLKELAGAVAAVDASTVPTESAHEVEVDLLLLQTLVAGVVLHLVHLVAVVNAGIGVPVQDAGNADFKFLHDALAEHQRELNSPNVQV